VRAMDKTKYILKYILLLLGIEVAIITIIPFLNYLLYDDPMHLMFPIALGVLLAPYYVYKQYKKDKEQGKIK
jgi:spore germination protein GerM